MAYNLDQFCSDTRTSLASKPLDAALNETANNLSRLLANPIFVAEAFAGDPAPGKRELFHDAEKDFYVLAHVQAPGKGGTPHSHGASWAIYGNAMAYTDMTEYRRVNPEAEEAVVLEVSDRYRLMPGDVRAYGPGVIHSTSHTEKAWVVRITGTDLDQLPRYHFKRSRDRVLEEA